MERRSEWKAVFLSRQQFSPFEFCSLPACLRLIGVVSAFAWRAQDAFRVDLEVSSSSQADPLY